ncbi:MAG: hypothetical protein ACUVR3_11835 [Candidatus Roseilinea sp.]
MDALCPFGGVETLWRFLFSGGQYVPKTHLSNLVLLGGLVIGTLIAGVSNVQQAVTKLQSK